MKKKQKTSLIHNICPPCGDSYFLILYQGIFKNFYSIIIGSVFLLIAVGIILSKNPFAGWYTMAKFLEFLFFGFAIKDFFSQAKDSSILIYPLTIGILFESILAVWQFFQQSSIGGIFYFLGERTFNGDTPGIANVSLNGQLFMRPYATFSHPNVLAGYLVIAMTIIIFSLEKADISSSSKSQRVEKSFLFTISSRLRYHFARTVICLIALILGTFTLFLTLSRVAIILWLLILCYKLITSFKKVFNFKLRPAHYSLLAAVFLISLGSLFFLTPLRYRFLGLSLGNESITDRILLMHAAWSMIIRHPLFGVGFGNFLTELPFSFQLYRAHSTIFLQPVHNFFLLIAAETGIPGLVFVLWFLYRTVKKLKKNASYELQVISYKLPLLLLFIVITLGMFDHYFLTLQQGQLLLTLVLAICWSKVSWQNDTISA